MRIIFFGAIVVVFAFMFSSCKGELSEEQKQKLIIADSILKKDSLLRSMLSDTTTLPWVDKFANCLPQPTAVKYTGNTYDYKLVEPCLKLYKDVMEIHGFRCPLTAPQTRIQVPVSRSVTYSELFRGDSLLVFLENAARLRGQPDSFKNLAVSVEMGIYTESFAINVLHDPLRAGRMALFLVTKKYDFDKSTKKWKIDEDPKVFDFGGINP